MAMVLDDIPSPGDMRVSQVPGRHPGSQQDIVALDPTLFSSSFLSALFSSISLR